MSFVVHSVVRFPALPYPLSVCDHESVYKVSFKNGDESKTDIYTFVGTSFRENHFNLLQMINRHIARNGGQARYVLKKESVI